MPQTFTLRQRLRYRFDNTLARGIWGVLAWLGVLALAFMLVITVLLLITGIGPGGESTTFPEGIWFALTRALDPGTFSGDEGLTFRIVMLVVTIVGIFLAAAIIGLVSSAIDARVENLRRGRSQVIETGHTLIVGRNDKLAAVISELVKANMSEKDRAIVVLTPDDVVEVSDELRSEVPDMKTSRLVVRSGNPTRIADLAQGNPAGTKSVIVLRPHEGSDAQVVKAVLAVSRLLPADSRIPIVAELEDGATAEALTSVIGDRLHTVTSTEVTARIGAQVSRSPGLGQIYEEFLDFEGDELYAIDVPEPWVGRTFGEALLASSSATVIGLRNAGGTHVGPATATVLQAGDRLIAIAEDDSRLSLDRSPVDWVPDDDRQWQPLALERERMLIIGWSPLAPLVAQEIDTHVAPESEIHLLVDVADAKIDAIATAMTLEHQSLTIHPGSPISRRDVENVLQQGPYDHVLLLSEKDTFPLDEADARTMLALLHVRDHIAKGGATGNIVAELVDPHYVDLTAPSDNSDFIVSERLIGLLIAQLSESPDLAPVFKELFDAAGMVIDLHPIERYVPAGQTTFRSIIEAARDWGITPIGVRAVSLAVSSDSLGQGIRLNPSKDEPLLLAPGDAIVVVVPAG
jgi:hypothetical protein